MFGSFGGRQLPNGWSICSYSELYWECGGEISAINHSEHEKLKDDKLDGK